MASCREDRILAAPVFASFYFRSYHGASALLRTSGSQRLRSVGSDFRPTTFEATRKRLEESASKPALQAQSFCGSEHLGGGVCLHGSSAPST